MSVAVCTYNSSYGDSERRTLKHETVLACIYIYIKHTHTLMHSSSQRNEINIPETKRTPLFLLDIFGI